MNTLNGNFIERSIPNIKNATLNLLIGDQVATMNLADFQTAIFSSYSSSKGLKMKDGLPLSSTLNTVVDSNETITESPLQLSTEAVGLSRTVNLAAGATTPRLFNVAYTINNSGAQTGTLTGIFLNATETALGGMTHNLMDLQVGGVSKFSVSRTGVTSIGSTAVITGNVQVSGSLIMGSGTTMATPLNGIFTLTNYAGTDFNRLQLGGTTSSFPAIKRNGAAIDFRLADDSDYIDLNCKSLVCRNGAGVVQIIVGNSGIIALNGTSNFARASVGSNVMDASSSFQINSTTQGFLMPRMTQAQILAIVSPANGLQVYNTDLAQPCFYDGTGWRKVSHSAM